MIFKGKRFFKRMLKGELSNILKKSDRCIVQRVTEKSISYTLFDSWKCFEMWYRSLNTDERTFSEVITEGPQKFRLDIDCPKDKWIFLSKYDILYPLCNLIKQLLGNSTKLLIYESVDPEKNKYSFHIITQNVFLESSIQCTIIADIIKSRFEYSDLIDSGVYKSLQCFRLEGSRKPDSQRIKYILGTNSISNNFLEGIISNIENCIPSGVFHMGLNTRICKYSTTSPEKNTSKYSNTICPPHSREHSHISYRKKFSYNS